MSDFIRIEEELRRLDKHVAALIRIAEEQSMLLRKILRALEQKKTYPQTSAISVKIA
jgi:hypothetical protein